MAAVLCFAPCIGCKEVFGFNPMYVPALPWHGTKHPVCLKCIEKANPRRIANGLEAITPHPLAYAPVNEEEMVWSDDE